MASSSHHLTDAAAGARSGPAALTELRAGSAIPFGGDRVTHVPAELAERFRPGDHLVVVQETGDLLLVPAAEHALVRDAVGRTVAAFGELASCSDDQITEFFHRFALAVDDDDAFGPVLAANDADVRAAAAAGRSTTRLELTPRMRADMAAGLRTWRDADPARDRSLGVVRHDGWRVETRRAPLGTVGFVFEGRPNVFADAAGVVRSGNTVVFRIGSDALRTARAMVEHTLAPALAASGLPDSAVVLIDAPSRAAGWALFGDRRLALAVARGSGPAVAQLGAVARQAGVPVSLHGTGGAWLLAAADADADRLRLAVTHSLDRKVCNTVNVCCVVRSAAERLVPVVLDALDDAATARGVAARLHVEEGSTGHVDAALFERRVTVRRADGDHDEPFATTLAAADLGVEWEWESSPELTLVVVDDLDQAVALCNRHSPRFVVSVLSEDPAVHERAYQQLDAPFVGDAFTRWVDGQYALGAPELGLSNWQGGRLLARGAILSGDSVHTIRYRAVFDRGDVHR